MLLRHYQRDGTVRIVSRLLNSPAHQAGVRNGATLLSYNGASMHGLSRTGFLELWKELRPRNVEEQVRCRIRQGGKELEIAMTTKVIQGPIPDWSDHFDVRFSLEEQDDWHQGMVFCKRTGQIVPTARLTDAAINRVFR